MSKPAQILWLESVNSTNDWSKEHMSQLLDMSVICAKVQTSGRGQGDHKWHSEAEKNLLFSILLKEPSITSNEAFAVSAISALALVEVLSKYGIDAKIKWPNDIYVGDKKICGLLIEHSLRGSSISWSIIGVGLNVNQTVFPPYLPNPTSMAIQSGVQNSLKEVLDDFLNIFSRRLEEYTKNGDINCLRSEFDSFSLALPK